MKCFFILYISLLFYLISSENQESIAPDTANTLNESSIFSYDLCDLVTEAGICLFNGEKVLTGDAQPKGLIGHWSFDDAYVL